MIQPLGNNEFLVDGKIELDEIRHSFDLDDLEDPNGNVTLGGYITSINPNNVEKGFTFEVEGVLFTVLLVRQTVVERVKIRDTRQNQ
jgi:CBS domain containing-hemolysin-like protein